MSQGGHPSHMGGALLVGRIWTRGSQPPLAPIMPRASFMPRLPLAPITALPSPPWWRVPPLIPPVAASPSHPRFLFRAIPGIIRLRVLLLAAIRGGVILIRLLAHLVMLVGIRLCLSTPFLLRSTSGFRELHW